MINAYQSVDYSQLMKNKKVLIVGYHGEISAAIRATMEDHGAKVFCISPEKDTFPENDPSVPSSDAAIDSLIFIAPPVRIRSLESTSDQEANQLLQSSVLQLHRAVKIVLPYMKQHGGGTIVAVTSDYAVSAVPNVALYSAAMASVNAYVRALSMEYCKYGIRGNCVMMGFNIAENGNQYRESHPAENTEDAFTHYQVLQRRGTSQDVAYAVLFCASDMSNSITGENFPVDGGALAIGHSQVWPPRDKPVFTLSLKEKSHEK